MASIPEWFLNGCYWYNASRSAIFNPAAEKILELERNTEDA